MSPGLPAAPCLLSGQTFKEEGDAFSRSAIAHLVCDARTSRRISDLESYSSESPVLDLEDAHLSTYLVRTPAETNNIVSISFPPSAEPRFGWLVISPFAHATVLTGIVAECGLGKAREGARRVGVQYYVMFYCFDGA